MRSTLLTGVSFLMTALVVGNAYVQRQQFYPSVVYITKSNSSMAVIYIQALVFILLFGKLMSKVFFGRLRAAEFEHLMERSWYAVTETCLAFTVFKDDFSPKFVALFSLLLFLKSFHWLAEDRVDFMERSPSVSLLFHFRIVILAALLTFVDGYFMNHAYHSTVTKGASVQLVFGFEYAILLTIVANTMIKYVLHSVDLHSEHPWEGKAVCMLYAELLLGFVKVLFYVMFIAIMVRIYTLPLFAVRPMYLAMRAFKKALSDVVLSRRAIHNMNTWYPDATVEELAAADNVCIICREEMLAPTTKKLPCNHIFHKTCLRSWFQRQQTCPTCRLDVLRVPLPDQRQQGGAMPAAPQQQRPVPQQQPAQPPPPPMPPLDPQLFAQMMNNARYGTPSSAATTSSTASSSSTSAAAATSTTSAGTLPFPPPFPLPFAFMPPLPPAAFTMPPPPPMPPSSFSGLTDAELSQLEGTERANVEARVKCLRNIQVLLDAAVLEMQQYSSVVVRLNSSSAAVGDGKVKSSLITPETTGTRPKVKADSDEEKEQIVKKMDAADQEEEQVGKKSSSSSSPELAEVRKRWREKFGKNDE